MLALEVIHQLSAKELRQLSTWIKKHKRASLKRLYSYLKKNARRENIPREKLYEVAFETKYEKKKDYLLRKEFQYLNEAVKQFLIHEQAIREYELSTDKRNYLYLKALLGLQLTSAFDKSIDQAIEESKHSTKLVNHCQLYQLKSEFDIRYKQNNTKSLKAHLQLLDAWENSLQLEAMNSIRELEARRAYLINWLKSIGNDSADKGFCIKNGIDFNEISGSKYLAKFYELTTLIYLSRPEEAISYYKAQIEALEHLHFPEIDQDSIRTQSLSNLGKSYSLIGDFLSAETTFLNCIAAQKKSGKTTLAPYFNSIMNYINMEAYQKGIDFYHQHIPTLSESISVEELHFLCAYCYLFLNNPKKAIELINSSKKSIAESFRINEDLIYIIAFCIDQEFNLALNACKNLNAKLNYKNISKAPLYKAIVSLLKQYSLLAGSHQKNRYKDLQKHIETVKSTHNISSGEPSIQWLEKAIQ